MVTGEGGMSKRRRLPRKEVMENIGRIQDLVGGAIGKYRDDRNPSRAELVVAALEEAFDLCLRTRD